MPEDHHVRLVYHCTNDINYKKIVEKGFRFGNKIILKDFLIKIIIYYNIIGGHKDKDTGETLPILNGAVWGSGIYAAPGVDFASNYA